MVSTLSPGVSFANGKLTGSTENGNLNHHVRIFSEQVESIFYTRAIAIILQDNGMKLNEAEEISKLKHEIAQLKHSVLILEREKADLIYRDQSVSFLIVQ
jgi:hypothetical protein